jgi:nicotinamide mononucleotide (NMN) deamidase PncC
VVSEQAAIEMAEGAAETLGADIGLSLTGVAGPTEQDGQPVGTVWVGIFGDFGPNVGAEMARPDGRGPDGAQDSARTESHLLRLGSVGGGDREQIRQFSTISALDFLRRRLLES